MCGINGIVSLSNPYSMKSKISQMNEHIKHRGPDSSSYVQIQNATLGHTRLSIHDLSENGSQPMFTKSKRYIIVFNGEIYNYQKLKRKYKIHTLSTSDTEVLIELIELIGIKRACEEIIGMFAFSVYDTKKQVIYLCRDRIGEKPLYKYNDSQTIYFSSELKSFEPFIKKEVSEKGLESFFSSSYINEKSSIFENVSKVEPGQIVEINTLNLKEKSFYYWSLDEEYNKSKCSYRKTFNSAIKDLDEILKEVIDEQLDSDVPIGSFLSGGVDSSLVSAIAQNISTKPINTFSIGFRDPKYNEAVYAKEVANYLKTNHTELYTKPEDCISLVHDIKKIYDEPFADSSQLPTLLLSRLTKEHVTVCLSGDGGDEVFCGYERYLMTNKLKKYNKNIPYVLKKALKLLTPTLNIPLIKDLSPISYHKAEKLNDLFESKSDIEIYKYFLNHWNNINPLIKGNNQLTHYRFDNGVNLYDQMCLFDMKTYLPSDIFTKVDRASMSTSLETRAPLVDKRIIEFSLKLPIDYKVHEGQGKYILREILYKYVDKKLIERPKKGFSVPIEKWLRNELKEWATPIILKDNSYLDKSVVKKLYNEHMNGIRNWSRPLWDIIIFNEWYQEYVESK
ncbi:asparagine synthase (glutamine-hydrolyzing) [Halobacteriovorax sp. BALOs_7]|uniref:asparagine synthase (glutamine-hydrolyzing) n=1 Tax=Halobacteriovorax sp. BALOs_7 TaxID=2109558 RepID=UPI000EA0DFDA|nr:asparagine synthase (glutamine-hydrolyzing) [Halobacteriovorax sp. BALOs_7]